MRNTFLRLAITLIIGGILPVHGQSPEIIEAAFRATVPELPLSAELTSSSQILTTTTSLGCKLIPGLPLPDTIEVHRLVFQLDDSHYAVHVSADGSLIQACDPRFPNLGAGTQPVQRETVDGDGDGIIDSADRCPEIAGIALDLPGCPQASASDRDGDGTPDRLDSCPEQAGVAAIEGCAILNDADGDGAPDHIDICRADFGVIRQEFALGCPYDGSGASRHRRNADDICQAVGIDVPVYASRADDTGVIRRKAAATVVGRTAALDWYQVGDGWVKSTAVQLKGACYNIPLVNPAVGGATGCYLRPRGAVANIREAPAGKMVASLRAHEQRAVLGANAGGSWLFTRQGWVSRDAIELAGACDSLPVLDPSLVASGTIRFCPPGFTGLLPPRIGVGEANARVASSTLANRLRAGPDYLAEQIGEIPPGRVIDAVLDGPACQPPFVWWQVEVDGQIGWTVESDNNAYHYYLEPVATGSKNMLDRDNLAVSETALPASNRLIHSANIDSLDTIAVINIQAPTAVAWSPLQSALLAISAGGNIQQFDATKFTPIPFYWGMPAAASAIAFSPDEHRLAAGDIEGGVTLIARGSGLQTVAAVTLGEQSGPIRDLAWNKSGDKLAAISGDESLKIARQAGTLKLWQVDTSDPNASEVALNYRYPYPLTSVAFSRDGRWLAVSGESSSAGRAALWVYDSETGDLALSIPLVPMRGQGFVSASPTADLGDFVYSSGDSLYQLHVDSGEARRFYHWAGAIASSIAFRPQYLGGAEALMALVTESRTGTKHLRFANALNPHSPSAAYAVAAADIAFSPDGRLLAITERNRDRIRVVGVTAHS